MLNDDSLENELSTKFQEDDEAQEKRLQDLLLQASRGVGGVPQAPQGSPASTGQTTWKDHVAEIPRAIGSGLTHAVENSAELLDDVWDWAGKNWESLNEFHAAHPDVPFSEGHMSHPAPVQTGTGKVVEGVAQFMTAFIPATGALKVAGLTQKFGSALTSIAAGGVADFAAFDPTEKRVADAIQALSPDVRLPVINFLTSDEDDSAFESRLKNVGEGVLLGGLGDVFFKSVKALRSRIGTNPVQEGAEQATKEVATEKPQVMLSDAEKHLEMQRKAEADRKDMSVLAEPTEEQIADVQGRLARGEKVDPGAYGLVNIDNIKGAEDFDDIIHAVAPHAGDLLKRSGIPLSETWDEAAEYAMKHGYDVKKLKSLTDDTDGLTARVIGARMVHADVANQVMQMAEKIASREASPVEMARFEKGLAVMTEVQAALKGVQRSIGATLNSYKYKVGPGQIDHDIIDTLVHAKGGSKTITDKANRLLSLRDNPKGMAEFMEKTATAKTLDTVQFWWINSLLSSPTTWVVNALSNTAVLGNSVVETGIAGLKGSVSGKGELRLGDLGAQMMGMYTGLVESLRVPATLMRAGGDIRTRGAVADKALGVTVPTGHAGGKDQLGTAYTAFFKEASAIDPTSTTKIDADLTGTWFDSMGSVGKVLSNVISTPGRVLAATDEIFKTMIYRGHLAKAASTEVRRMTPNQLSKYGGAKGYITDRMSKPTLADHKDALLEAKRGTFTNDLGTAGKSIQRVVNEFPVLRFAMPFIRTPTNIIKYTVHHTPILNRISSQVQDDLAAGGVRAEMAKAKVNTGAAMYATAGFLAANGLITGGAHDDYRNGRNDIIGRQAYSIKIGDTYYSFSRTDPIGFFLGITADMAELIHNSPQEDWNETAGGIIVAFSQNFLNKTYLRGLVDICDALMDTRGDAKKAERWMANFTSSFIPNLMNQTNRIHFDKFQKEVNDFTDNFKRRVYVASGGVMNRRNQLTGEPLSYKEGLMGGYLNVMQSPESADPVERAIYEAGGTYKDFGKTIGAKGTYVEMTGKERDAFAVLATQGIKVGGKNLKESLHDVVTSDWFQAMPNGDHDSATEKTKLGVIRKVFNEYHHHASNQMIMASPEIQARLTDKWLQEKQQKQRG